MTTSYLTDNPRLSRFSERTCQNFFKKIFPNGNIFWQIRKICLSLPLNSWATFAEAHKLKNFNEIASFAMFLSVKSRKFQSLSRMGKVLQRCGFCLFDTTGHPRTSLAGNVQSAVFVCIS